ncbi:MAG TPA: T9SS type A sorting domain-containing protein [Xanthomarina sp.]|nr:T9SS type A sorting domain-containing protein [Xanthomarina sp.]
MIKNIHLVFLFCLLCTNSLLGQENFKVMFYNLLNFPYDNNVPNRIQYLDLILSDYQPDLFMVCELNNLSGAQAILQVLQSRVSEDFESAVFTYNTSDDNTGNQNDLQNLMFYNSSKFILESQHEVPTLYRDFNHYKLKLNSTNQSTNPVYLNVIVCHLKASSGANNQALRLEMVQDLTTYLNGFPANSNVMLAGDLNVYSHLEPAISELLHTENNIVFADPADRMGNWHNNTEYLDMFTQSTRNQTGLGGASGGFDDRFDFILTSTNMLSEQDIYYVDNSYKAYGNNGNLDCYNQEIKDDFCEGVDFSSEIRDALYYFSDHLPVTLQLVTNQTILNIPRYQMDNFQIIGSNIVENLLEVKINKSTFSSNKLYIYNTLGQVVKVIPLDHSNRLSIDVSHLSNGLYYIHMSNTNVQPLKFIK